MANYLEAIARELRRPEEQLRLPADLLRQGYDPSYLARMRPDELYQLDAGTLARVKRAMRYQDQLADFKREVREEGQRDGWWTGSYEQAVATARTRAEVTAMVRNVRSRRSSSSLAEANNLVQQVATDLLVFDGPPPADPQAWIAERSGLEGERLERFIHDLKLFIQSLLLEDASLVSRIFMFIKNNAVVQSTVIGESASAGTAEETPAKSKKKRSRREKRPTAAAASPRRDNPAKNSSSADASPANAAAADASPADASPADANPKEDVAANSSIAGPAVLGDVSATESPADSQQEQQSNDPADRAGEADAESEAIAAEPPANNSDAESAEQGEGDDVDAGSGNRQPDEVEAYSAVAEGDEAEAAGGESESADGGSEAPGSESEAAGSESEATGAPIEGFKKGRPAKPTRSVSTKELSPRQRRRRWLKIQLKPYYRLRRALSKLSPYQVVMLDRGNRSQILKVELDYDRKAVANMARESLRVAEHPFSAFLRDAVDYSVDNLLTAKVEQDVFAAVEEQSQQQLIEFAVEHLQAMLLQRPVRGQRIFLIDAIGKTTAAGVIIDPEGRIDHVCDIPCTSVRAEAVNQTVSMIGELVHRYQVTLIALSTGPQRRFLLPCIREFLQQSDPSTVRWTMVDRDGAEMYCQTRLALQELPTLSRRHRAATWLGWRLQDPLVQLLKVEPTQLRLAAFQAELPPDLVRDSLQDAVAAAVAARGLDYWNAPVETLATVPGLDRDAAKTLVVAREQSAPASREALAAELTDKLPPNSLRQAIGFLRIFDSPQPLDGTLIHPDDYRLAQRLIEATELTEPPATPVGWTKRQPIAANETEPEAGAVDAAELDQAATTSQDSTGPFGGEAAEAATTADTERADAERADAERADAEQADAERADAEQAGSDQADIEPSATEPSATEPSAAEPTIEGEVVAEEASSTQTQQPEGRQPVQTLGGHALMPVTPNFEPTALGGSSAAVDVEKFARMWQVGREKLKFVANSLQHPFDDLRDRSISIPLMPRVPKIEDLQVGHSYWAVISGIVEFGAFADLGPDCSGLIHVSQLTQNFVIDPHQVANIGDLVQVWVLEIDPAKRRISLSALSPEIRERAREANRGYGDREPYRGRRDGDRGHEGQRPPRESVGRGKFAGGGQAEQQARAGDARSPGGDNRSSAGDTRSSGDGGRGPRRGGGQGGGHGGGQGGGAGRGAPAGRGDNRSSGPRQDRGGRDDRRGRGGPRGGRPGSPNLGAATVVDLPSKDLPKKPQPSDQPPDDGKEPMRSFSDLLKNFQSKHEQTKGRAAPPSDPPPSEGTEPQ